MLNYFELLRIEVRSGSKWFKGRDRGYGCLLLRSITLENNEHIDSEGKTSTNDTQGFERKLWKMATLYLTNTNI